MYDDTITEATVNYHVNLPQIAVILNQNSLIDPTTYSFSRDWSREWIQSVYKAFLLCFQLPVNPLHDSSYQNMRIVTES
ncbi:18412_t:CDS:2 [Funneliformis geosporum]|nr:18412_t:CDS:2 [Funneliformis geosporum]